MITIKELINVYPDSFDKEELIKKINEYFAFSCKGARTSRRKRRNKIIVKQSYNEVLELLDFLKDEEINSYLEIGLEKGGNFFLLSSIFRKYNENFDCSLGIDIKNSLYDFIENDELLILDFCNCLDYKLDKNFDYIFIDTNQSYSDLKKVFEVYKNKSNKFIAFHDVNDRRWGNKKFFNELKETYKYKHFSHSGAGIGLIDLRKD